MFVEFMLDGYSEDPVNLLVVRLVEKGVNKQEDEDPGEDVYWVEHILESRGMRDVVASMTVKVPSEYNPTHKE